MLPRFFFKYPHITKKNGQKSPCHPHFGASHIAWDSIYRNFWLALTGGGWVGQQDSVKMTLSVTKFDMWGTPNWIKSVVLIFFHIVAAFFADLVTFSLIFELKYLIQYRHITWNFFWISPYRPPKRVQHRNKTILLGVVILYRTLYMKILDWR